MADELYPTSQDQWNAYDSSNSASEAAAPSSDTTGYSDLAAQIANTRGASDTWGEDMAARIAAASWSDNPVLREVASGAFLDKGDASSNWLERTLNGAMSIFKGSSNDLKAAGVMSLIGGIFSYPQKKATAEALTKNAESAARNAKTNEDLAANTITLRNNSARGLIGGNLGRPATPVFQNIPEQRLGRTGA